MIEKNGLSAPSLSSLSPTSAHFHKAFHSFGKEVAKTRCPCSNITKYQILGNEKSSKVEADVCSYVPTAQPVLQRRKQRWRHLQYIED